MSELEQRSDMPTTGISIEQKSPGNSENHSWTSIIVQTGEIDPGEECTDISDSTAWEAYKEIEPRYSNANRKLGQ